PPAQRPQQGVSQPPADGKAGVVPTPRLIFLQRNEKVVRRLLAQQIAQLHTNRLHFFFDLQKPLFQLQRLLDRQSAGTAQLQEGFLVLLERLALRVQTAKISGAVLPYNADRPELTHVSEFVQQRVEMIGRDTDAQRQHALGGQAGGPLAERDRLVR